MVQTKMRTVDMLVVDDDPLIREVLMAYYTSRNIHVIAVPDAATCLQEITKRRYDVVVLDAGEATFTIRPYDLAATIKDLKPSAVLIGHTGRGQPIDDSSFDAVVTKGPDSYKKILDILQEHLLYSS